MQILALISGKGGVGKTTLAANIAVALSQRQKRVLVIDLDPQNALRNHLGMDPQEVAGWVREGIAPTSVFDSPFGVKFIPFGRVSDADLQEFCTQIHTQPQWVANGITSLGSDVYDFVVLDTPPGPGVFLQQALHAAHRALAVILADAASYATVGQIEDLVSQYTQDRTDFLGMHFVINQMPTSSKLGHQVRTALYTERAAQLVPVSIHRDARVAQALAYERPLLEYDPGAIASLDVHYLADWLLDSAA